MTSTSFNVGLGSATRNSSKVLKPPGGGSSDIFGTSSNDPEPQQRKAKNQHLSSSIFSGEEAQTPARKPESSQATTNGENAVKAVNGSSSASSTASTPASAPAPAPAPTASAPSKQRVPPGGFSSGLW